MKASGRLKRIAAAVSAVSFLSGAIIAGSAGVASASDVPNGYVEFCAFGNYKAYIKFPYRPGTGSTVVPQGQCWYSYVGGNSPEPIKVYGIWNSHPGQSFYIGTVWYNGAVSGMGISAVSVTTDPYLWIW